VRQVKYLNNLIEQDHRFIKRLTKSGMGFFSFESAWRTLHGYEVMHMVKKGQMRGVEKETSWGRPPLSPACLEWRPKLNRKVGLHIHRIPPDFLQHNRQICARLCCPLSTSRTIFVFNSAS
jgi:DDE domain